MARRGPRQIVYVCSAIINGKLISEMIEQEASDEAQKKFLARFNVKPEAVLGPFYRKRTGILLSQSDIKFSGKSRVAIYNDWYIKGLLLSRPEECVWVFFEFRVDGKKQPKPQNLIVKMEEVEFLTSEQEQIYKKMNTNQASQ